MEISRLEELRALIIEANEGYSEGKEIMSDRDYDSLIEELRSLSPEDKLLTLIGHRPKNRLEALPIKMASLDKIHSIKDYNDWKKSVGVSNREMVVITPKLDGISLLDDNHISKAWTRGDGASGQQSGGHVSLMNYKKRNAAMPSIIQFSYTFGEAVMVKDRFIKYSSEYKNSRSLVASQFNRDTPDTDTLQDISYIRYGLVPKSGTSSILSKAMMLNELNAINPYDIPYKLVMADCVTEAMLDELYHKWRCIFPMDGLVIEVDNLKLAESMGRHDSGNPRYAVAYKGNYEEVAYTILLGKEWSVSKRGYIKPVGMIEPVDIDGVTVSRVTLYNAKNVIDNRLGNGSIVKIKRSGMVIPKIVEVCSPEDIKYGVDIPNDCPSCGEEVSMSESSVELVCTNKKCRQRNIAMMTSFLSIMEVDDIQEGIVAKLYDAGCKDIISILEVKEEFIENIDGFGKKKASNIVNNIKAKMRDVPEAKLMHASCCFENIGESTLSKILHNIDNGKPISTNVGSSAAEEYIDGLDKWNDFWDEVKAKDLISIKKPELLSNKCSGWVVVMTGFRSKEMEEYITSNGGSIGSSVTGKTTHLVCEALGSGTTKETKAKQLGVKIYTKDQFKAIL